MAIGGRENPNLTLVPVLAQLVPKGITGMFGVQEVKNAVKEKLLPLNEWA